MAGDDCTRAFPEAAVKEMKLVSNYVISAAKDRVLTESFTLSAGESVQIVQSGCHHFGFTYRFKVETFPKHKTIPTALRLVKPMLEVTPLMAKYIYEGLLSVKDKKTAPEKITITEGYNWVYLSTELKGKETFLVVTYDVAL